MLTVVGWFWLLLAAAVLLALGYAAWEFRWYWTTLTKTFRSETDTPAAPETRRDLVLPRR